MTKNIRPVAFDLETIADQSIIEFLPEIEAKKNLKDEAKIQADISDKTAKRLNELGMDPLTNLICCFSWCDGSNIGSVVLKDESHASEKELLLQAWDILAQYNFYATFNGISFDVRTLNLHSMRERIHPGKKIDTKKYQIGNHMDLRMVLGNWESFAKGKLDYYLKIFFGEGKMEGIDGSLVQHYWDVGLVDDIQKYCEKDAEETFRLYELVRDYSSY